jgi:WD40 repeat protein
MAWKFRRGDGTRGAGDGAPALVSKLLGHVAAVVGLSTGNPAHLVSGAHDGTVRVWDMPRLSDAPGARGAEPGTDLAGVIDDIPLGPESDAGARGSGSGDDAYDAYDASGSGSGPGGLSSSAEEADAAPPPAPERREALYAVTGHTVWLGDVCADDERIVCDGANNVTICYDFTEDPDGDGEI